MTELKPFADDATSVSIGGLTIENGTTRVALYGSLDLTRDKAGLAQAKALQALVERIMASLEGASHESGALPDAVAPPAPAKSVKNPFT